MNKYGWLFIGFMFGIIVAIIIKIVFNCKSVRRNRRNAIVPRRTIIVTHKNLIDSDSDNNSNYSISIEEESKEELHVRMAENL